MDIRADINHDVKCLHHELITAYVGVLIMVSYFGFFVP